jgi:hypothetical protein
MLTAAFEKHCREKSIQIHKNPDTVTLTDHKHITFTEYKLITPVCPMPMDSNVPSHILLGIGQNGVHITCLEKHFPKETITLSSHESKNIEDFTNQLSNLVVEKPPVVDHRRTVDKQITKPTDTELHQALQEYCNENDIPASMKRSNTHQIENINGKHVAFHVYEILGMVKITNAIIPNIVSFCEPVDKSCAELRFYAGFGLAPTKLLKIIPVDNLHEFKQALRENLVLDIPSRFLTALNAKIDNILRIT